MDSNAKGGASVKPPLEADIGRSSHGYAPFKEEQENLAIRAERATTRQNRVWTWFCLITRMVSIVFLAGFFAFGAVLWGWTLWDLMAGDKREIYFSQLRNFLLGALSGGAGVRIFMHLLGDKK